MSRSMSPVVVVRPLALAVGLACLGLVHLVSAQPAAEPALPELDAALAAYTSAYNQGDVDGLMAVWSPKADFISFTGQHYQGREAITTLFRTAFADSPGRTIKLEVTNRQQLSDDTVMDDGVLQLTSADGRIDRGRYVTIWGRENGKWVVRSVRDMPPLADPGPRDPLGGLAWLAGGWKSADGRVTLDCRWRGERKFLEQRYSIAGETPLEVVVFIVWDPAAQQIRSWFFDTAGGLGDAAWSPRDDGWRVVANGVLPDGRTASAVETWTPGAGESPDRFTWRSFEREVGGEHVPDIETIYERSAPAAEQ